MNASVTYGDAVNGSICARATEPEQVCGAVQWLSYVNATLSATAALRLPSIASPDAAATYYHPLLPVTPSASEQSQLSRFSIRDADGGVRHDYIEPLTGVARHPFAMEMCGRFLKDTRDSGLLPRGKCRGRAVRHTHLFDLSYLVPANHCNQSGLPAPRAQSCGETTTTTNRAAHGRRAPRQGAPRNLFFDLGCTVYQEGKKAVSPELGSGAGPSLPLFFQMYERRCIVFDELHGWEIKHTPEQEEDVWWSHVPEKMRPRLRYYHAGINETGADGNESSAHLYAKPLHRHEHSSAGKPDSRAPPPVSFLRLLKEMVEPDDFVVVKVDIDGGPELPVMRAIANDPSLYALIDEIFFEYHFYFDGRNFGWGTGDPRGRDTVDDALALMQRLRHRGIRSHFWI